MRFEFVPPAQLQPETLPTLGLPCCAATFHAPQVTGALQVWLVGLHDPLLQSLSATQVPPVPHRPPTCVHAPVVGLHASVVQALLSLQAGTSVHRPPLHMLLVDVQMPPSVHAPPLLPAGLLQPAPLVQRSVVQTLPSAHALLFGVWMQPTPFSQASLVHAVKSSQAES